MKFDRIPFVVAYILLFTLFLQGQAALPSAPIPTQVLTAQKVFISNVPGAYIPNSSGGPRRAYDALYAEMKVWGKYELVSSPRDADIVLAASFVTPFEPLSVTGGNGPTIFRPQLQLVIIDPKTNVTLWWLAQDIQSAFREKTAEKNFDEAVGGLINQLKKLVDNSNSAAPVTKQ